MRQTFAEALLAQTSRTDLGGGELGVHRWYLRRAPMPPLDVAPLGPEHLLLEVATPPTAYYRFLYNTVGGPWLWYERRRMSDAELAARLAPATLSVTVLFEAGRPMGYFELDRSPAEAVDLAYFGLMPWAVGRGLGPRLLAAALDAADGASRPVTINTCSLDHPKALETYERSGFEVTREEQFVIRDPRLDGTSPPDAGPYVPLARG